MRLALLTLSLLALTLAHAAPVVWQVQDPVQPGQTVMLFGDGFGDQPRVFVGRLGEGPAGSPGAVSTAVPLGPAQVLQARDQCVKFVLPPAGRPGLYAYSLQTSAGKATGLLNRPTVWWAQIDSGTPADQTPVLRLFGKSLSGPQRAILLQGPRSVRLQATGDSDPWAMQCPLPTALPPGDYTVRAHCGYGGPSGWSEPAALTVAAPPAWPTKAFNIRDFGADGSGTRDDTAAVQAALDTAGAGGGGVVLLPRGRYQITTTLTIPRGVELRGERQEWTALFWPDMATPPEALIKGTNSFALAELTIYASNHRHIIAGDLGSKPDAGNVRLERLRVRGDAYRGHLKPEQVDERFRQSLKWSTGGGDTVRVGGENVVITDCDLYGSGRSLYLSRARHSLVANNQLYNGRWGWYCLEGSDGLIFEHNLLQGADLMSTGGGIANYSTACSRNIYYSYNEMRFCHGWDREVMTTDAGGEAYFGKIVPDGRGTSPRPTAQMTLAADGKWGARDWTHGGVFILDGQGAGQWRWLKSYEGRSVTLDRPWDVAPDASSTLGITMFHGRYAFVGNSFTDCGAFQFYGTSVECDVVGNTAARNQGYQALGLWYHGFQPSWYCQFLGNTIAEGNYYHWTSAADSLINIYGARRAEYDGPLTRGAVVRGNTLQGNSHISVSGSCANVLVAQNRVANSDTGIFVSQSCREVLTQGNTFTNVTHELMDEPAMRQAAQERLAKYLNRPDPVLVLSFEEAPGNVTPDASGNNFAARLEDGAKLVDGGVTGKAVALDGTGYLRVNEPAVFNAADLTVDFWIKPAALKGRRGLIAKRFGNTACPFVINQTGAAVGFEATDEQGKWSFNFTGPTTLKANEWSRVTVVMKTGSGGRIFVDGKLAAEKQNPLGRQDNTEPLILGREAWGGDPATTAGPGCFIGLMDQVRIWTRALTDEEVMRGK